MKNSPLAMIFIVLPLTDIDSAVLRAEGPMAVGTVTLVAFGLCPGSEKTKKCNHKKKMFHCYCPIDRMIDGD